MQVPVSPPLAFFLCVSRVKLRFCMMRTRVGETPLLLGEMPLGGPGRGERASQRPQDSQLSKETQAQACKSENGHIHAHIHKLFNPDSSYTHTPLPGAIVLTGRDFLDDIVKQLHGLHDVLILDREKRSG